MNSTWLVTGGTGFLGRYLLEALDRFPVAGRRIVVATRQLRNVPPWIQAVEADLTDPDSTRRLVEVVQPEVALHLAGRTPPAAVPDFYRGNLQTTLHMRDALIRAGRPCRWVAVGSAAEVGPVPERSLPIRETHPCRPIGAYGLSKWFATRAVLDTPAPIEPIVARVFNPIGPGQPRGQAFGRFAERLVQADGDPLALTVGDLSPKRDFIDARDVAEALVALAERARPHRLYQVATGTSRSIRAGLDRLIAASGRDVVVRVEPALGSANGPSDSRAAIDRIAEETGWRPRRSFEQSLDDLWAEVSERGLRNAHRQADGPAGGRVEEKKGPSPSFLNTHTRITEHDRIKEGKCPDFSALSSEERRRPA